MKRNYILILLFIACQPLIAMEMELQQRLSNLQLEPQKMPPLMLIDDPDTTEAMESDDEQRPSSRIPLSPPIAPPVRNVQFAELARLIQSLPERAVWHLVGSHPHAIGLLRSHQGKFQKKRLAKRRKRSKLKVKK